LLPVATEAPSVYEAQPTTHIAAIQIMSTEASAPVVPITRVENFAHWFSLLGWGKPIGDGWAVMYVALDAVLPSSQTAIGCEVSARFSRTSARPHDGYVAVIEELYDTTIGEAGCIWAVDGTLITSVEAKVNFGDLFQFYTSADGVLRLPECSMRAAVRKYLKRASRIKRLSLSTRAIV
jgi:hypothetical protein